LNKLVCVCTGTCLCLYMCMFGKTREENWVCVCVYLLRKSSYEAKQRLGKHCHILLNFCFVWHMYQLQFCPLWKMVAYLLKAALNTGRERILKIILPCILSFWLVTECVGTHACMFVRERAWIFCNFLSVKESFELIVFFLLLK
jgi:hypothetical protein